jgi:sporulation protein YlmC with PRC-barrel domain
MYRAVNHSGMADILAENLSGKTVMGDDGAEIGLLYNITMRMKTGQLGHLIIDPGERSVNVDFEVDQHSRYLVPVSNVQAVKDHIVVRR